MTKKGYFKDARLLEALEYIDRDLVGEVAVKLKFDETAPLTEEPVMTWRTPFKHWKRMLATAVCLILLSCAIPIINYVLPRVGVTIGGNAGAGTSELEASTTDESKVIDSLYERSIYAYPEGMSAKEIYADVLKGGWVVNTDGEIVAEEKAWEEFLSKTDNRTESTVLIACYYEESESIFLKSVSYDGEVYSCDSRYICQPENKDHINSYTAKYLVCHDMTSPTYAEKRNWDPPVQFVWFLTDYPEIPFIEQLITFESENYEFLSDNYPTWFDLIWLNDESEIIDIDFDKTIELFADMSADEIYTEVLKGGWVVIQDFDCENIVEIELWTKFLNAVEQGKECSVWIAYYSEHVTIKFVGADDEQYAGISQIVLTEVKYDGNKFVKSTKWYHPDYKSFYSSEYSYLLAERHKHKDATTYYLANKPDQSLNDIRYSSEKVSMDSAIILDDGLITVWEH
ncbi:MAG: hypothetical protein J6S71_03080 [Clostridia bacterium]|nr:hypothetical protein [Clostridia bacterium]